jgi:hypothetical protein
MERSDCGIVERRRLACVLIAAASLTVGSASGPSSSAAGAGRAVERAKPARAYPWRSRVRDAAAFARGRSGDVSFALVDERGRIHGFNPGIRYSSASLVKAMLLVAYLRQVRGRALHGVDRALLAPMIRVSDNDAATAVYDRVGPDGLTRLARRAGMHRFVADPVWGGCQVTARDQARFFFHLRELTPRRHRDYALRLLRRVIPAQSWGIPRARPAGWRVHFKGGWFPDDDGWRVHQGALLRRGGRHLALAVLTRGNPGLGYGAGTIQGIAARLLRGYRVRSNH